MLSDVEHLLRAEGAFRIGAGAVPWPRLARLGCAAGVCYGAVMGALGWNAVGSLYSAVKLPILLAAALLVCLPNFYVLHALLGLRADFADALRAILSAQGTVAVALCAEAPLTAFTYACGVSYPAALLWNAFAFGLAALCGQTTLARHYRILVARDRRHRTTLLLWFALYAFVGIKVGWVLRPFVGDPALPTEFLREGKWLENPYTSLFWTAVAFVWGLVDRP